MADVQDVTEKDWEAEVIQSQTPVLVDFWAPWCGPCRMLAPTVDAVAREFSGRLKVVKLNVDEARSVADRFGVQGIPVLILFKGGKVVDQLVGASHTRQQIVERLETHLE